MLKLLIKNEFLKVLRQGGRKSKKRAAGGAAAYLIMMGAIGLLFMLMSFSSFYLMAPELINAGVGWLCFTYAVIFAVFLAVVGSVFMAQSQLYRAKDNDLLLSLPIPPWQILFCRMLPLYAQNFYFCFVVLFPAFIAYAIFGGVTVLSVLFLIIGLIIIPMLCTTLCCLLGFLVALVASRLKHANIVAVIFSLILFAAYFAVYIWFSQIMQSLTENGAQIADGIKGGFYPLYAAGTMMTGDAVGFAVTFAICVGSFAILYLILSKTYYGLITRSHATVKSVYREKKLKRVSVWGALIGKEAKAFFRSTAYLLNCGIGVVMLFAVTLFLAIGGGWIADSVSQAVPGSISLLPALACVIICTISSMDCVTAPSVSLEGKSLYILQSLPVKPYKPLFAKLFLHVAFNAPMAVIAGITAAIVFKASALAVVMLILMPVSFNLLFGALGLIFNLKKPMLDWENETIVIKQSISVLLTLLCVFGVTVAMFALYAAASLIMSADWYLFICFILITAGAALAILWLKKRGAEIWEEL